MDYEKQKQYSKTVNALLALLDTKDKVVKNHGKTICSSLLAVLSEKGP
jgi:hypothetical protein